MLVAGVAFTQVVKTFGPVRTTMIMAAVPMLATVLAVPLLGESMTPAGIVGLVCVTLGLLIGVRAQALTAGGHRPPGRMPANAS
jgi:drug/metabolite transporter (DMT)-like permease